MTQPRRVEYVPLDEVQSATRNPKRHDLAAVRASIERFGLVSPALRDERTGRLVAGHGRTEVLRQMRDEGVNPPAGVRLDEQGRWLVPVQCGWASNSDAEAEAYGVIDNHYPQLGGWDYAELDAVLADVDEELAELTHFDRDDLADLIKASEPPDLDQLADELGDPEPSDTWPFVRVKVPPHVAAAWRSHLDTHDGQEADAFAALLGVELDKPEDGAQWSP